MQKVLFLVKYPLNMPYNVKGKVNGQMEAVRKLGFDVYHLAFDERGYYLVHGDEKRLLMKSHFGAAEFYMHTKAFIDLYRALKKCQKFHCFDVVYIRNMLMTGTGLHALRKMAAQGARLVVEIPTYPLREKTSSRFRRIAGRYSARCWDELRPFLSLYTMIGEDIPPVYKGVPAIEIENGIWPEHFPLREPAVVEDEIHLLALASMCTWHGYDRLIRGLAAYSGERSVMLHLVGDEGDGSLNEWKTLVRELGMEKRVCFEGKLYGEELNHMFAKCDLGMSSFGVYRRPNNGLSSLKVREYTVRGLPFVYTEHDLALKRIGSEAGVFCLRAADDERPVDMARVAEFALSCRKRPELPALMRGYAETHMSWTAQMRRMLETVWVAG